MRKPLSPFSVDVSPPAGGLMRIGLGYIIFIMYNVIKKALTFSVVASTMLWSVGIAALIPSVAQGATCPTLAAGDMIKVTGKAAIYALRNDLKVVYFPSGDEFKSWRPTYGGYISITQDCFDSLSVPSNYPAAVGFHPGSYLVKRPSSDQLYVVEPNNTLAKITSALATTLYGTSAYSDGVGAKVMTISDVFWPHYVNRGTDITTAVAHPGMLFKVDSTTYYVDEDGKLREVTDAGFTANNFQKKFVRTLTSTAIAGLTAGTAISAEIASVTDKTQSGGITTTTAAGTLTVALSSATPGALSVPQNGTRVPFTNVVLTAGSDNAINVDAITVKRTGLSDYSYFAGTAGSVWAEKDGVRVTSQSDMNSSDEVNLTFSPILNIPAGTSVTLEIVASLNSAAGNGALGIASASAVSAGGVTVAGSFPVTGNLMSFTSYNVATASVDYDTATRTPKVGDTAAEISSFGVTQTATYSKDVIFKSIMLKNSGVEDLATSLSNVYLEKAGAQVSSYGTINGRYITFVLNGGGLLIEKGDSLTFKVKGDIMAKENASTPSFTFYVNKVEDVNIVEKSTGFGAAVTKDADTNNVDITSGALSITKKSTQPSDADVTKGTSDTVSLLANIRADEAISADGIKVGWEGTYVSTSFQNAKVYLNSHLLGTFDPTDESDTNYEIETSVNFNKGDNELKIMVGVKSTATSSANIKFKVVGTEFVNGESPEYVSSGNSVDSDDVNGSPVGAIITVAGAGLTIARNDGYAADRSIVQGTTDVSLGKFNVKATSDTVTLTSIEVAANSGTGTKVSDSSVFDMKLMVDGVQVGTTRDFNSSGASFSGLNVSIAKDAIKSVEVVASFDTMSTGSIKTVLSFNGQDSNGKTTGLTGLTGTTVNNVVIAAGVLTATAGTDTADKSILLAKSGVEYSVATFKLTSQYDSSNITEMTIVNSSTLASDARISSVKLYDGSTLLGTDFVMSNSTTISLDTNSLIVPANGYKNVTVKVVLNTIDDVTQSSSTFRANLTQIKYKGSAGSELTKSTDLYGNVMQIRKTRPVFANVSLGSSGLGAAEEEVLKFTVTADSNEEVVITSLTFTEEGSVTSSVSNFKLYVDDSEKASVTSGVPTFTGLTNVSVAAGQTRTFSVRANTTGVAVDKTYGISLEKTTVGNVTWAEYFVGGNNPGDAEYLNTFPMSNSKKY